ncbi:putative signaling protein [Tepidimonas sediminis]|uniref:Putative signaling protein n=2 Tax=Tepidimonas sediminis TaxID=2588941 RepID=A0A554WPU7_9BURK|nr:EAL domain-containing protein [Tepidimonas sediminis]TSE25608.1 putative signaling protein [Tepidimonas sediminis]
MKGLAPPTGLRRLWRWLWQVSFLRRLALSMALLHVLVLAVTLADVGRRGLASRAELERQAVLQEARQLAAAVRHGVLARDLGQLTEQVDVLRSAGHLRYAMVLDTQGRVLAHTAPVLAGQYVVDDFSRSQLQRRDALRPFVAQEADELLDVWAPVWHGSSLAGWVRIGHDLQRHALDPWTVLRQGWWYGLLTVAAGLLLAAGIARNLGRDLGRLQALLRRVRQGHLDERIAVTRQDELGELMEGVNRTLQRLQADEAELRRTGATLARERAYLRAVLGSMRQGVLALDADGRVQLCNATLLRLLGLSGGPAAWQGVPLARLLQASALPASAWRDDERAAAAPAASGSEPPSVQTAMGGEPPVAGADGRLLARDRVPLVDDDGRPQGTLWLVRDVTDELLAQERLRWQALHDPLTRLPNRLLLGDRLQRAMARARRSQELLAVCMLDLDDFKRVNDVLGHEAGDGLLVRVAERLRGCIRAEDTVARLGGDEFVLLLGGLGGAAELERALTRVCETVARPMTLPQGEALVHASIGVTLYPVNDSDADTLLRHADQALYQAKQQGGNRYVMFDLEFSQRTQAEQRLRERLRVALEADELVLHYQPRVRLADGRLVGAEALVRWPQGDGTLWTPDRFIPLIEQDALIELLGEWAVRTVLRQQHAWRQQGCAVPVAVNIAARHFLRADFVARLQLLLAAAPDVPAGLLEIELVESAALDNLDQAARTIEQLRALGISVAIDDFGMGYASLGYLRRLPVDKVKIDRSFVMRMLDDADDRQVVQAIIGLAHTFGRTVVAEGVEHDGLARALRQMGCDEAQGYGVARPMPMADWPGWVERWRAAPPPWEAPAAVSAGAAPS